MFSACLPLTTNTAAEGNSHNLFMTRAANNYKTYNKDKATWMTFLINDNNFFSFYPSFISFLNLAVRTISNTVNFLVILRMDL